MRIFGLTVAFALVSCFCSVTATVGFLDKIKNKRKPTTTGRPLAASNYC